MTNAIANLSQQIAETQKKLVNPKRTIRFSKMIETAGGQKSGLERRFNNLVQVRTQVKRLRDDLSSRAVWNGIREGVDP